MPPADEHVHPDDLALVALGEHPDGQDDAHLARCAQCQTEVDQLRAVVATARTVTPEDVPQQPSPRVWDAIVAELGLDPTGTPGGASAASAASDEATAAVIPLARARRRTMLFAAAAAVAGLVAGSAVTGLVVSGGDDDGPRGTVVASTRLAALPEHEGSGDAEVLGVGTGRILELDVSGLSKGAGFYEVWLLGDGGKRLVALGVIDPAQGPTARFPLPADLDLSQYPIVDISLEPADGDPAHSGDSIVRGVLEG